MVQGKPRTLSRDYIYWLTWERLDISQYRLEEVAAERDVWASLLRLLPLQLQIGGIKLLDDLLIYYFRYSFFFLISCPVLFLCYFTYYVIYGIAWRCLRQDWQERKKEEKVVWGKKRQKTQKQSGWVSGCGDACVFVTNAAPNKQNGVKMHYKPPLDSRFFFCFLFCYLRDTGRCPSSSLSV